MMTRMTDRAPVRRRVAIRGSKQMYAYKTTPVWIFVMQYGCAAELRELEGLWPKEILTMSICKQARYADAVCRRFSNNKAFLQESLEHVKASEINNTTGVGNIAYLALYSDMEFRKEYYLQYLRLVSDLRKVYNIAIRWQTKMEIRGNLWTTLHILVHLGDCNLVYIFYGPRWKAIILVIFFSSTLPAASTIPLTILKQKACIVCHIRLAVVLFE